MIDISRVENIHQSGGKTVARCPACAESGKDTGKEHLVIYPDGKFGCVMYPGDHEHNKRIFALVGTAEKTTPLATQPKAKKIHATLDDAAKAAAWAVCKQTGQEWRETRRDIYQDANGKDVAAVLRFDRADGATDPDGKPIKSFRPVHVVSGGWETGDPKGQWPLFNLPALLKSTEPIYVTEGEKAASAGAGIGLTCITSAHGAKSPQKTDWRPLAGRDVILLPDRDRPGRAYADSVAGLLQATGARSIRILELPGLPPKGDLADFLSLRSGQTPEAIRSEVERLAQAALIWMPAKRETPLELPREEVEGKAGLLDPIAAARSGTPYAMTDLGNAERFVALHGDSIRWDMARRAWRTWDGRRWGLDSELRVNAMAADTARQIRREAAAAPAGDGKHDIGRDLFAHAVKSESRDRLQAMLEVAKARPGIAIAADVLDADPWALNVLNGTINLRTGKLRPHNREDLLTKLAPVEYRPGCLCERWEQFLSDATGGDADLIAFLQVVAGYTLTGDTSEEKLFLVYGPEAAGKTTFLESLRAVLGEYARTIQADLLTKKRDPNGGGASPELACLAGARMAAGSEMEQGREIAEALAKNITGGESITARYLYAGYFDFLPQFKIWLALNHCPKVSADDGAIWRRILRIGFEHTVPPERRDKTLKPYLRDPNGGAPAVLAWAVEGCLRWQKEGLHVPDAVSRSTDAYRQESDPLAAFFEDCLQFTPAAWTLWADIWKAYCDHCEENGTAERYRVAPKRLQERLRGYDCQSERRFSGRGWSGIELKDGWKSGNHVGHDAHDATLQTFSMKPKLEKLSEMASLPSCPSCSPVKMVDEMELTGL